MNGAGIKETLHNARNCLFINVRKNTYCNLGQGGQFM